MFGRSRTRKMPKHYEALQDEANVQPLILLLQGIAFFVPRLLWDKLEDGTVKGLRMELNLPYLDTDKQATRPSES